MAAARARVWERGRDDDEARPLLAYGTSDARDSDHPETRAGLLSKITFAWLDGLLKQGAAAPLQLKDLWNVREADDAEQVAEKLRAAIRTCAAVDDASPYALWRAIRMAFGFNMYLAGACKLTGDILGFVGPICINELIKYVEDASSAWFYPRYYGYIVSATLFAATACQSLCLHQHHHLVIREAIRVRSALSMVVHEKALALSSQTKSSLGSGLILNLATTDANRLLDLFYMIHYTWAAPLQLVIGMLLLVRFLGYAAFAGIAVMVVLVPLSALFSAQAASISKRLIGCTDKRLKFLSDVLRHIRVIKFYAWEAEMLDQVEAIREDELGFLKRMVYWNSFSQVSLQAGPILVSLASFAVYSYIQSEPLTADAAFTSLTLFSIFRLPLMALPRIFSLAFQAHVSVERFAKYLAVREHTSPPLLSHAPQEMDQVTSPPVAFEIRAGDFGWNESTASQLQETTSLTLADVSITIPPGKLTLVVGPVGSGKSTLLAALLNELKPTAGLVHMPTDHVSYAAQSPYLVNASIEDNIVFGGSRDMSRLRRVIESCELQSDLDMLPDGIQTELGENGINLSGGQKQRVSIARAAYPDSQQMYIFDDPLSALDAKVSTSIFNRSFSESPNSLLAGKTRVLATHSLQFAKSAQWIIVMDKMRIVQMGTYEALTTQQPTGPLAKMLETFNGTHSTEAQENFAVAERKISLKLDDLDRDAEREAPPVTRLIGEESRAEGSVSADVYASYLKSCGIILCVGALAVLVSTQVSQVSTDLWLTQWTSSPVTSSSQLSFYLSVYAYLSLITIGLGFWGDLSSRLAGLSASRAIHHRLLRHVIKGTMRFFDTTPIGRVLNRFSNDMNTIDQKLNASVIAFTTQLLSLMSLLIIQTSSVPLLLAVLLPVFGFYYSVQLYYRKSCRELQRLDSITKSPIYAHFTETLNGLVTIRAFQMVPSTLRDQASRINENTRAFLSLNLINRWLGVRLESLGALIILGVACFVSREHAVLSSAMAGLLLSYSQSMSGLLNWIVRSNIDMENAMNSIERTDEYCHVDTEALALRKLPFGSTKKPFYLRNRPRWPEHGEVVFKDVQVKYSQFADPVLRGVSFTIKGGEKVGICGRTGAGKSSLLLTLFRLVPTHAGRISIDGVDTSQIDLSALRSRMAIIPQEPVLFAATVRFNLDPTGHMDDATLWRAIKKSHLHDFISRLPGQLDAQVVEAGENFSLGERQLICLARAILRDSKILCLDEATASMDHNTDNLIQSSIRREFASATVLTIAHRVQTIIDYDKIMVLKQGRVVEYGTPQALLAIQGGELASMVEKRMGVLPVDKAREAATRAYDELQIPVGSPPEHVVATFRTLCLQRAFHINDPGTNSTNNNGERTNVSQAGGDAFQREAVAYRFLRSLPLLTDTDYKPGAILARLRPLEEPRFRDIPSTERASAMLDVCITTMEQAQRTWQLPYTNYVLTVHYCLRKHIVRRRYSEFASLHAVLQRKLPVLPALPERSWLLKLQLPSERAQHLTKYILRVIAMLANRGLFSLEMMTFLDIDFTHIRAEEEALAIEYLARASDSGGGSGGHLFYILSASWLETWKRFVASGRDPPAKIENGHLLATREEDEQDKEGGGYPSSTTQPQSPRQGLVLGHSYRCINFVSWQYLSLVYGGGPVLIRKTASIYGRIAVDMQTIATTMQKLVRGFLGRQRAATRRLYVLRQDPTFEKRLGTIERQRLVEERMAMVRNYVSAREYQIRHIAIIKIQRAFRKHLLRHEHALLMAESAVPNAAETFQHVEEYFSLEEIGLIRDVKYRLAHFLVTMNKGVPIQKLRSRRKVPQWRLFRIDAIGSQLLWSSKKKAHALAFIDITTLVVESPLLLKTGFGRRRSTTYDHAVVLSYEYDGGDKKELILICESQCDCDALYFGLHALMTETRARTANGATYVDGHGLIRKKYPHAKRLISDAQQLIDQQVRSPFRINQSHADRTDDGDGSRTRPQYEPHPLDDRESHQHPRDLSLMTKLTSSKHATWSVELVSIVDQSDERVRRRREQFKAYQKRRRVNYRLRLERLEHDVHALAAETSALQAQSLHLFSSRGTDAGAPANLVAEFYRVYAHGHCAAQSTTQSQFVKAMMAQDVQGPEFSGVEALIEQFQLYGTLFASATYHPERTTVRTIAETTLVIVDMVMTLRSNRRGVRCLLPHVADDEVAVQCLVSQPMVALGAVHFLFNAAGKVTWHGAEIDFVGALNGLTGSIQTTADWLAHANFSLSTGRISSAPSNHHDDNDPMPVAMPPSERHAIAYLLS